MAPCLSNEDGETAGPAIRGWALVLPAAAVWWLGRPARIEIIDVSPVPPRALPLPG